MTEPMGPGHDWRRQRQRRLILFLRVGVASIAVLALGALVAPTAWRPRLEDALVVVLIGAPLVRVAWLAQRWARRGDWRFFGLATGLLAIAGLGAVLG